MTRLDGAGALAAAGWLLLALRPGLPSLLLALVVAWGALFVARGACSLPRVVLWGLLFRLIALAATPVLEDDWNRYLWDGYRFAQDGTPYGRAPIDFFDDASVPVEMARTLDGINNPDLPTIYGPLPQAAFLLAYLVSPGSLWPLKLLLLGAEIGALALLWRRTRSPAVCLLWFWCPLLVFESAFNAHPEVLGLLALLAALAGTAATPLFAALAAATRPFGLLLAPLLLSWKSPRAWALFLATLAVLYLPPVLTSGGEATSLGAMAAGWEFNSSLYALVAVVLEPAAARMLCALLFGVVAAFVLWRHLRAPADPPRGEWLLGALFLCSPVLNPWYLLWLLPFAVLRPSAWIWTALAAVSLSYFHGHGLGDPALGAYEHPTWVRPLEFGAIAVAVGVDAWRARRSQ